MKLHLPGRLRAALLASCAVCTTLLSGTVLPGSLFVAAAPQAQAATLSFDSEGAAASHITWKNGTVFGQDPDAPAFEEDDSVVFYKPAVVTIEEDVTAEVLGIRDKAEVTLKGGEGKLTLTTGVDMTAGCVLTFKGDVLTEASPILRSSGAKVVFDWGEVTTDYAQSLATYQGSIEVRNSTLTLSAIASYFAFDKLTLTGQSTLLLDGGDQFAGGAVVSAPVIALGDNVIEVASGEATLRGELSGSGTLTKEGEGILCIGPSDSVHSGDLVINAGSVHWGDDVGNGNRQYENNTLCFNSITINAGAEFDDSHTPINLSGVTDIILNGGTLMAYDMLQCGNTMNGLMENYYRSLTVNESGTLDFEFKGGRHFGVLTGSQEAENTLTLNNGRERTYTKIDLIEDFNGTITGENKTDTNRLILNRINMTNEEHKLTISQNVMADSLSYTGPGALVLEGDLTAENNVILRQGAVEMAGVLTAQSVAVRDGATLEETGDVNLRGDLTVDGEGAAVHITGGTGIGKVNSAAKLVASNGAELSIDGRVEFLGSVNFRSGSKVTLGSALVATRPGNDNHTMDGAISVSGKETTVEIAGAVEAKTLSVAGQSFKANHLVIGKTLTQAAGETVIEHGITTSDLLMKGGSLTSRLVRTDFFSMSGGTLEITNDEAEGTGVLNIAKGLTMNYSGDFSCDRISLANASVLSYVSGRDKLLTLGLGDLAAIDVLFVDVSQVSAEDLRKGINLGLGRESEGKLRIGSLAHYTLETRENDTLYLVSSSKTPTLNWDKNWNSTENPVELATAPGNIREVKWVVEGEKVGLYRNTFYDDGAYTIAANVTGGTGAHIYGGAYGTQPIDAEGGTIERDVWLNIAGGKFVAVVGGSYCEPTTTSGSAAPWHLVGDTHIQVGANVSSVGSVIGGNMLDGQNPSHTGNTYISVYSPKVEGAIVGAGMHTNWNTTYYGVDVPINATIMTQEGSTHVFLYTPLGKFTPTEILDHTGTEISNGMNTTIDANAVIGGMLSWNKQQTSIINGDTNVTLDFDGHVTSNSNMVKNIVGGHYGSATQRQTGNGTTTISNVRKVSFNGFIAGGHYAGAQPALTSFVQSSNQSRVGNSTLTIQNAQYAAFNESIAGIHYSDQIAGNNPNTTTQTLIGDSNVTLAHAGGATFNALLTEAPKVDIAIKEDRVERAGAFTAGHYAYISGAFGDITLFTLAQTQTQQGNTTFTLTDVPSARFAVRVVAGHYAFDDFDEIADARLGNADHCTDITQTRTGNTTFTIAGAAGANFTNEVVAGHDATGKHVVYNPEKEGPDRLTTRNVVQTYTGDTHFTITGADKARFSGKWVVGGHFTDVWHCHCGSVTQTHTTGDIYVTIDSGIFDSAYVAGDVYHHIAWVNPVDPDPLLRGHRTGISPVNWISNISGKTVTTITGGTFNNKVVGGSCYYFDPNDVANTRNMTASIGSISMTLGNASFNNTEAVTGGFDVDGTGLATVGDINVTFNKGAVVNGEVYGGSWYRGDSARGIRQGDITLNLKDGTFRKDIYAAGRQDAAGTIITASTTVNISDSVKFGKIQICGGYRGINTEAGRPGSVVMGDRTLAFTSAGSDYSNISDVSFSFFDTVEVTKEDTHVMLNQSLQKLSQSVTKTGAGTLELQGTNDVDTVIVRGGTLKLAGNSTATNMMEHLLVEKGGTLDLSAGNVGINGELFLSDGSTLALDINQRPATVNTLNWDGTVNLQVNGVTPTTMQDEYSIDIFTGLTQSNIAGIGLTTVDGIEGLATPAGSYLHSITDMFSAAGSYLVLRDGTLTLTSKEREGRYWEGGDGVWDSNEIHWYSDEAHETEIGKYSDGARTYFIGEGREEDVAITVAEDVAPYTLTIRNGSFVFSPANAGIALADELPEGAEGETEETEIVEDGTERDPLPIAAISITSALIVESADAVFNTPVVFSQYSGISVDGESTLTFNGNESVEVYNVNNSGDMNLNGASLKVTNQLRNSGTITCGDMELAHGTAQAGTVHAGNVKLGGNTTFTELQAAAITGNKGRTLTVGGNSMADSLDGGSLKVTNGTMTFRKNRATTLTALKGAGSMATPGALTLNTDSTIGNLTTPALTVGGTLAVSGTLSTGSVTLKRISLNGSSVQTDVLSSTAADGNVDVATDREAFRRLYPVSGKTYYLLETNSLADDTTLTVNGKPGKDEFTFGRYNYTLKTGDDGVKMQGNIADKDYYRSNMSDENAQAGAGMLDALFTTDVLQSLNEHADESDLVQVLYRMDDLLADGNKAEAAKLAAAAGGASLSGLGVAFGDDIARQLKAIRNRTTTMGVDQCVENDTLPALNAWINAEGDHAQLNDDGMLSGYTLNSWGGTVGADVDFTPHLTAGLAITAMAGDYSATAADSVSGNLDTQYLSFFGRYARHSWTHTFVATIGRADVKLDRTVNNGDRSYTGKIDTDGTGFGLMYEVGYVRALSEDTCVQPIVNVAYRHSSVGGFTEKGGDASLKVDDMTMNTLTLSAGARLQSLVGQNVYNRSAVLEARALVKVDTGDTQAENDVAFAVANKCKGKMKSAEVGAVGAELGVGLTIPLSSDHHAIFADFSAELRSGYSNLNGTVGYRINF